jgi:hypothetical protein
MANFGETRFLGLTPRAVGLTIVAGAIVVGLFFIPEGLKFIFDGKPRTSREHAASTQRSKQAVAPKQNAASPRAALSREGLSSINADISSKKATTEPVRDVQRVSKRGSEAEESLEFSKGGLFSGWDFSVKARPDSGGKSDIPSALSFEKLVSRDGVSFFKQGRSAIPRFLKQEGLLGGPAEDAIQPLQHEMNAIISGDNKGVPSQEVANKLRSAHIAVIQGLRSAGADRGVVLRWLEVPVVKFIDTKGGVMAARRYREAFAPGLILKDLAVRQRRQRGLGSGSVPTQFRAEFSVVGSDIQKVVAYADGKVARSVKFSRAQSGDSRVFKINGDAAGVWTVVAYDSFGARPYSKSYSFYPKARVFQQQRDGSFRIAFLPGSGRNSLDRFFLVGVTARHRPSDSVISTF